MKYPAGSRVYMICEATLHISLIYIKSSAVDFLHPLRTRTSPLCMAVIVCVLWQIWLATCVFPCLCLYVCVCVCVPNSSSYFTGITKSVHSWRSRTNFQLEFEFGNAQVAEQKEGERGGRHWSVSGEGRRGAKQGDRVICKQESGQEHEQGQVRSEQTNELV